MKKILTICALALFLGASVIGCSGSSTTAGASGGGSPKEPAKDMTPKGKDTPPK